MKQREKVEKVDPNYIFEVIKPPDYTQQSVKRTFYKGAQSFATGMEPTFKVAPDQTGNKKLSAQIDKLETLYMDKDKPVDSDT